eukprot:CAMPEP_0117439528 /NCGR_PEP_ID=MMETSP0759-20121206/2611_1 /TAXON_ID=63605 /ORGANISM="Percolomonas cosmopolitus, Strain WS" /LENGTH=937 /DNA_ID=CAMNT_0005231245 /DNA_START=377 /DNA_END=3186 /DNA_ORIENTATION=+
MPNHPQQQKNHNEDSHEMESLLSSRIDSSVDSVDLPSGNRRARVTLSAGSNTRDQSPSMQPSSRHTLTTDRSAAQVIDDLFGSQDFILEGDGHTPEDDVPRRRRNRPNDASVSTTSSAIPIITTTANTDTDEEKSISSGRERFQSPPRPHDSSVLSTSTSTNSPVRRPSMYNLAMYNERYDDEAFFEDEDNHLPPPPPISDEFIISDETSKSTTGKKGRQKRKMTPSISIGRKKNNRRSKVENPLLDTHTSGSFHLDSTLEDLYQNPSTNNATSHSTQNTSYGTLPSYTDVPSSPSKQHPSKKPLSKWNTYVRDFVLPKKMDDANDALQLGPLEKLVKYRKFPWKLLIDLILCALLFIFVALLSSSRKKFIQANARGFVLTFLPDGLEEMKDSIEGYNSFYFLTKESMQEHIKSVVHTYENFEDSSVGTYMTKKQIWMETTLWDDDYAIREILVPDYQVYNSTTGKLNDPPTIARTRTTSYPYILDKKRVIKENLTVEHPYGIFAREGVEERHLFDQLVESKILLSFESLDTNQGTISKPQCFNWTLTLKYDFSVRSSRLPCKATYEYTGCHETKYSVYEAKFNTASTYIAIAICLLSSVSLLLNIKAVISRVLLFVRQKRNKDHVTISWSKFFWAYFSFWFPLALCKDLFNVIGTAMFVISTRGGVELEIFVTIILGLGCLTSFFSIIRYLQYIPKFYVLIMTIRISIPFALRYLTGVMPLFMGYTLASVVWFGHYVPYFSTIDIAAVSNFCCLHGDVIRDTFDMLYGWSDLSRIWGRIYLYSFVLLFITVILTMFLLIIEDAYFGLWAEKDGSAGSKTLTSSQAKPTIVVKNDDLKESFLSPHFQDDETPVDKSKEDEALHDMDQVIQYYTKEVGSPAGNRHSSMDHTQPLEHVYIRALVDTMQRKITRRRGKTTERQQVLLQQMLQYATDCTDA